MDNIFGIYGDALRLRSERMAVLASNIANAATPNYKARDFDFNQALQLANDGHKNAASAAIEYRVPLQPSIDGNTVELSTEQALFGENARFNIEQLYPSLKGASTHFPAL